MQKTDHFQKLIEKWPSALVARSKVPQFTGYAVSAGHMANVDCQGRGPKERVKLGRIVAYPVDSLVEWLREQAKTVE